MTIDLSSHRLPVPGVRKMYIKTAAAEAAWFTLGTRDLDFMGRHSSIWSKFTEDLDGHQVVKNAYGYRYRHHFKRDQLGDAIQALIQNPSDRRIVVSAWDPAEDGLGRPSVNVPCPAFFTLSILDGQLNTAYFLRSSDVFVGLPYDIMTHSFLMAMIHAELEAVFPALRLGTFHITMAHPHLYEDHVSQAKAAINHLGVSDDTIALPTMKMADVAADPEAYVSHVEDLARRIIQPDFQCNPKVIV